MFDGCQFIDGAEFGIAVGRDEALAHTITVDAAALGNDRRDSAFVQTVGSHDFAVLQSRLEGVVSVDQEDRGTAINFGIALECIVFSVEEHDPTVRHGADHGDAEGFSGESCGRAVYPTDVGRASAVDRSVDVVCTARTHIGHRTSLCSAHNTIGLCGDEGLVVDLREEERFNQLRFNDRCSDGDERLIGIDDGAFGDGINVSGETEIVEIFEKCFGKQTQRTEIGDVVV